MTTETLSRPCEKDCTGFTTTGKFNIFNCFHQFFFEVFALAIKRVQGNFIFGEHIANWCDLIQAYPKTCIVSARKHLKTTVHLGYIAWKIFTMDRPYNEWLFMSYKDDLASYHLRNLKRYIKAVPEAFGDLEEITDAETYIRYRKNHNEFVCEPAGILSCERGRHPHGMIIDDILRDPTERLDLTQIEKITNLFLNEVESMPTEECHIIGTPQDAEDLFSRVRKMPEYFFIEEPAIKNGKPLWEEKFSLEVLENIKENILEKAFNKEYLCRPVRGEESFISYTDLEIITCGRLKNYDLINPPKLNNYTYGGLDIGKHRHPSHLCILAENRKGSLVQVHSKFMDGWNYTEQVEYCKEAIKKFNIAKLYYDNTRAEFEGFSEAGDLPAEMEGVSFSVKEKFEMAGNLDKFIAKRKLKLINDARQRRQLLSVDNDLRAIETQDGHGDAFFSLCLAIKAKLTAQTILIREL